MTAIDDAVSELQRQVAAYQARVVELE